MKRQSFRLGSVLRYYELQKQRAEYDLHQASRALHEIDAEIARLNDEIAGLAALLSGEDAGRLSTAGWIACYRNSDQLGKRVLIARGRRNEQATIVTRLEEQRKRWAVAEGTLVSLRRDATAFNHAEEAKAIQLQLDETVLRKWLETEHERKLDS